MKRPALKYNNMNERLNCLNGGNCAFDHWLRHHAEGAECDIDDCPHAGIVRTKAKSGSGSADEIAKKHMDQFNHVPGKSLPQGLKREPSPKSPRHHSPKHSPRGHSPRKPTIGMKCTVMINHIYLAPDGKTYVVGGRQCRNFALAGRTGELICEKHARALKALNVTAVATSN